MNDTTRVDGPFGPVRKVSERLPEFLQAFPMEEGWGIEIDCVDPLSCRPGLMELYKECIRNQRTPRSLPDSDDPVWKALLFRARLTKNGQTVNTASCLQYIEYEYDYETGETRARSRLMSACGIGVDRLDNDIVDEIQDRGRRIAPAEVEAPDVAEFDVEPDPVPEAEEVKTVVDIPKPEKKETDIPAHLQAQVDVIAATMQSKGETVELPSTKKEALQFIRRRNSGNGASP